MSHANIWVVSDADFSLVNDDDTYTSELAAVQLLCGFAGVRCGIGFELRPIAKNIPDVLFILIQYSSRN